MPEANLTTFSLEDKSPQELEAARREIVQSLTTKYRGYDDPDVPRELLAQLAVITATLRRKNAGPPKKVKAEPKAKVEKKSLAAVMDLL